MSSERRSVTRSEIAEQGQEHERAMREVEERLDLCAADKEITDETLEALEQMGTSEGVEEVERSVEQGRERTVEAFERADEDLDEAQHEAEEEEAEWRERSAADESDSRKLADAESRLETAEARDELARAEEAAEKDKEFLDGQIDATEAARQASEDEQNKQRARIGE